MHEDSSISIAPSKYFGSVYRLDGRQNLATGHELAISRIIQLQVITEDSKRISTRKNRATVGRRDIPSYFETNGRNFECTLMWFVPGLHVPLKTATEK